MSGPLGSQQWMYATGALPFYPYTINNSLRFDGSSYLRRLSATSSKIHQFTMSFWVKISDGGSSTSTPYHLMSFQTTGSTATTGLCLYDNEITYFFNNSAYASFNPAKARDYSSWYHVVWKNKSDYYADIYVNGVLVGTTVPSFEIINGSAISVGAGTSGNNPFAGGYMADVHFVSGQSLGPDSFGEYDSTGTIWKPKAFSGSYGTDGFHLDFADGADLGNDAVGSNNFTPSGIATSDQMLDSPTNNFATLNPLSEVTYATTSEGNLKATAANRSHIVSTHAMTSGQWYAEGTIGATTPTFAILVIPSNGSGYVGPVNGAPGVGYFSNGYIYGEVAPLSGYPTYTTNDVIGAAVDMDAGTVKFYKNNTLIYTFNMSGSSNDWSIAYFGWNAGQTSSRTAIQNFGQDSSFAGNKTRQNNADENGYGDFYYTPPTGYLALCTQNLPDPTFDPRVGASPQDHFSVDLDADGSGALTAAQAVFPTGIWWLKNRTTTGNSDHLLVDSARGSTLELNPNAASAESTYSDPGGSSVAWSWKAASAVSGTTTGSGTLKSYSGYANATAGVSVITYEGNGTAGHQIPHHLGAAPSVVVVKSQDEGTRNWIVYHANTGASPETEHMVLNGTAAVASSSTAWNNTAPSASVVTLGSYAHVNNNTYNNIMYAFAEKNGFSKFGVYQGNFNADGPFVYLGFRPAFVMIKSTGGTTGKWCIFDAERDGYNPDNDALHVYPTAAEDTTDQLDILSNGFKIRGTGTDVNNSAYEYIYMAFAEQPFKYSLAR